MFTKEQKHRVLSIYPFGRSYAFVLFNSPLSPVDWGMKHIKRGQSSDEIAGVIVEHLRQVEPDVLVIDDIGEHLLRKERLKPIYKKVAKVCMKLGIEISVVSRVNVKSAFAQFGAKTKQEIAHVIAKNIEPFSHRVPRPRKLWQGQNPRMRLYDAASRGLTYYYRLTEVRVEATQRL